WCTQSHSRTINTLHYTTLHYTTLHYTTQHLANKHRQTALHCSITKPHPDYYTTSNTHQDTKTQSAHITYRQSVGTGITH
ncbi:hypothetical protein, partial [Acinetobacter baumannii]|uniref:hypothetical protein n=1 Tax=Acinetobacter baumannii TaxID=470 RepID=UPI0033959289